MPFRFLPVTVLLLVQLSHARPAGLPPAMDELLDMHCYDCHDDATTKGDLDLMALDPAADDAASLALWTRVLDRVESGEMPPAKKKRPPGDLVGTAMKELSASILTREAERVSREGRVVARRLNRVEYEHTLRDLLHLPGLEVAEMLPADPEASGFDNVSAAQRLSYVQLGRFLDAARKALAEAAWVAPEIERFSFRIPFVEMQRFRTTNDRVTIGKEAVLLRQPNTAQTPFRLNAVDPPFPGTHTLRFRGRAATYGKDAGQKNTEARLTAPEAPQTLTIYQGTRVLGSFEFGGETETKQITARLVPGEELILYVSSLRDWNPKWNKDDQPYRGPAVVLDWFELEGPEETGGNPESYHVLFGDLPVAEWKPGMGGTAPPELGVPKQPKKHPHISFPDKRLRYFVRSEAPEADAERLLQKFMTRAFRRPVPDGEIARYLALVKADLRRGKLFQDALLTGYSGVLCSPDFLFLSENTGTLDDHALASRLSYFLWRSLPDATLRDLADKGRLLGDPAELRRQTERLLADPKAERFIKDFTDQWLSLREINATQPDGQLYPESDDFLIESMLAEPRLFFRKMLEDNLPAETIVDSDFMFANSALAALYGIPGVDGPELREIPVPTGSPRGGFLTQGAILKVTANGTNTSPVVRGTWVLEHILGQPSPPPPPDVPAIEPDTRGATTVRQLLEKHREDPACAGCHAVIDPPGFALENFDVLGGWRDKYRRLGFGKPVERTVAYQPVRYKDGLPVDSTGRMKDGRAFQEINGFKKILLEDRTQIARNLASRLAVFATGAGISFSDRATIENILRKTEPSGHGLRDLIHGIVGSELFQNK